MTVPYTEQMRERVAVFDELEGHREGHSDKGVPGVSQRELFNVMGFNDFDRTPMSPSLVPMSGVGEGAVGKAAIRDGQGMNLAYVRCPAGEGVVYHKHDTNETFVVMTGRWRFLWGEGEGESVVLGPRDVVSFPNSVPRRFVNLGPEPALLLALNAGVNPRAFVDPATIERGKTLGLEGRALMPEGY